MAKLWGVLEELQLVREMGCKELEVQLDSMVVVHSLHSSGIGFIAGWSLVRRIKDLLKLDWSVRISHVYCETNRYVDVLANLGCEGYLHGELFDRPLGQVAQVLHDDARGV